MYEKLIDLKEHLRGLRTALQHKAVIEHPTKDDLETVQWLEKEARETEIAIRHIRKALGLAA